MDWISIILGGAGVVVTLALAAIGFFVAWGKINQRVKDQESDIADLKDALKTQRGDIEKAQNAAQQVGGLASAVEHMGERFADQIKHLVEVMGLQNDHVRTELTSIKDELKHVRNSRSAVTAQRRASN